MGKFTKTTTRKIKKDFNSRTARKQRSEILGEATGVAIVVGGVAAGSVLFGFTREALGFAGRVGKKIGAATVNAVADEVNKAPAKAPVA
jgi:hypothetical protein